MKPWFQNPQSPRLDSNSKHPSIVIIGSGLAGSFLAAELGRRGLPSTVLESGTTIAGGPSGNPVGVVKPYVTRESNAINAYYQQAFAQLEHWLSSSNVASTAHFHAVGAAQLVQNGYPDSDCYVKQTAAETQKRIGLNLNSRSLWFKQGGWLDPGALCKHLLDDDLIRVKVRHHVKSIDRQMGRWRIRFADENTPAMQCDYLILANGPQMTTLNPTQQLTLIPARGQLSRFQLIEPLQKALPIITGKHYVIHDENSVVVGASFLRGNDTLSINDEEHQQNLEALRAVAPGLNVHARALKGYAGIRATTPDRLPVVGPMPIIESYPEAYKHMHHGKQNHHYPVASYHSDLFVLGGFGARGITHAPLAARLLSDYLTCANAPIPEYLHPARFCVANLKRRRKPFIMNV